MNGKIKICGMRVYNLKNINLDIPREKLVVLTGLNVMVAVLHKEARSVIGDSQQSCAIYEATFKGGEIMF